MAVLEILSRPTNPPTNYIGATIFLSYIAAALYLTFSITLSLYHQYARIPTPTSKINNAEPGTKSPTRTIKLFSALAGASFATISWHMLGFLISSFLEWNNGKRLSDASAARDRLTSWMLESSLFQDFARDLVSNRASTAWTHVAILGSWFWGIWTARKARTFHLDSGRLFKFVALGQILPISFSAALVIIQLLLLSEPRNGKTMEKPRKNFVSPVLPTVLLNACLLAQPFLAHHPLFIITTLSERLILLLPYSGHISFEDAQVTQSIAISGAFVVANLAMTVGEVGVGGIFSSVWHGGSAIKTLGWDAVLGGLVWAVLWSRGGV